MKPALLFLALIGLVFAGAGCGHVNIAPESDPRRTVTGTVTIATQQMLLPPGTVVVIRVIDTAPPERPLSTTGGTDLAAPERNSLAKQERILGEQIVRSPGVLPVAFAVDFAADDATLRRGLTLEARLSLEGKLSYRALSTPVITLGNYRQKQEIPVEPVR